MKGSWEKVLRYAMLGGLTFAALAIIVMAPWGDRLSYSGSPQRLRLLWVYSIVGALPFAAYFMYRFAQHADWMVPPGRPVDGKANNLLSPYVLLATGGVGVLVAIGSALIAIAPLDFVAVAIGISVSLFGSIVSFFGMLLGRLLAGLVVMPLMGTGSPADFTAYLPFLLFDMCIWPFAGYVYFKYVHSRGSKPFLPAFIVALVLSVAVQQFAWFVGRYVINLPWYQGLALAKFDWLGVQTAFPYLPFWVLSATVFVPIGFLVGEFLRRAWKK